jgi:hypothetical protein
VPVDQMHLPAIAALVTDPEIAQVITELEQRGSQLAPSTIRTHIASRMCANAPDHHGTTYDDFERVGHGEYRWLSRT